MRTLLFLSFLFSSHLVFAGEIKPGCLRIWEGDPFQMNDEFGGLNAFPDYSRKLKEAIGLKPAYRPLSLLKKERAVYEAMLRQLGRRILLDVATNDFRDIEIKENRIHIKAATRAFQLTIEWTKDVTEIKPSGAPDNLTIKLPENYEPTATFESNLDFALTGHDLDRFTTTQWVQDDRGNDEPRYILKNGQREVLQYLAAAFEGASDGSSTIVSVQAPPAYGKTMFHTEGAKLRERRRPKDSPRNIYFEVVDSVTTALQMADSFRKVNDTRISGPVSFDVISMEDNANRIKDAEKLLKHAEAKQKEGTAVVVTVTLSQLVALVKSAQKNPEVYKNLKAKLNSILIDETSEAYQVAHREAIHGLIQDNPGVFLLGTDANYIDPRVRELLFKGHHIDIYEKEIGPNKKGEPNVIIDHVRIGSARGEITPLVNHNGKGTILTIDPKEIEEKIRKSKAIEDGVLFRDIPDPETRSIVFSAFATEIDHVLKSENGQFRVETIALADQWAAFLTEYFQKNNIKKNAVAFHSALSKNERAKLLDRWRNAPNYPPEERIDWIISPRSLDQAVDAPHSSAVVILTDKIDPEKFGELAGRPLRRYVGKQHAVIVHVTTVPMSETARLSDLTDRQEYYQDQMLNPTGPVEWPEVGTAPKPYDTSVVYVAPSPTGDPRAWDEGEVIPLYDGQISDVVQLTALRKRLADELEKIAGEVSALPLEAALGKFDVLKTYDVLRDVAELGALTRTVTIETNQIHHVPRSVESLATTAYMPESVEKPLQYVMRIEMLEAGLGVEPEIVRQLRAHNLELLMSMSLAYRSKLMHSWPLSFEEAKRRLFILKTSVPGFSDVDHENPASAMQSVMFRLVQLMTRPYDLLISRIQLAKDDNKAGEYILNLVSELEHLNSAMRIIFKENLSFHVLANHIAFIKALSLKGEIPLGLLMSFGELVSYNAHIFYDQIPHIVGTELPGRIGANVVDSWTFGAPDFSSQAGQKDFGAYVTELGLSIREGDDVFEMKKRMDNLISWLKESPVSEPPPVFHGKIADLTSVDVLVNDVDIAPSPEAEKFSARYRYLDEFEILGETIVLNIHLSKNTLKQMDEAREVIEALLADNFDLLNSFQGRGPFLLPVSNLEDARQSMLDVGLHVMRLGVYMGTSESYSAVTAPWEYLSDMLLRLASLMHASYERSVATGDFSRFEQSKAEWINIAKSLIASTKEVYRISFQDAKSVDKVLKDPGKDLVYMRSVILSGHFSNQYMALAGMPLSDRLAHLDMFDLLTMLKAIDGAKKFLRPASTNVANPVARRIYAQGLRFSRGFAAFIGPADLSTPNCVVGEREKLEYLRYKIELRLNELEPKTYAKPKKPAR